MAIIISVFLYQDLSYLPTYHRFIVSLFISISICYYKAADTFSIAGKLQSYTYIPEFQVGISTVCQKRYAKLKNF